MIFGVGTDLVEIGRIEQALARHGERFARRILCDAELSRFRSHRLPAAFLAKRFAAKEAFGKALGSGIRAPANWHDLCVTNEDNGRPDLGFSPALGALLQSRGVRRAHLSMSDERALACATVILECDD